MAWFALTVVLEAGPAEGLSDALLEQGALAVEIFGLPGPTGDPEEVAEGEGPVFASRVQVSALLDAAADPERVLDAAVAACAIPPP
ncbi:MAG TPA: hypothetical protein VF104_03395, partial [Burkholderiales bacterium]